MKVFDKCLTYLYRSQSPIVHYFLSFRTGWKLYHFKSDHSNEYVLTDRVENIMFNCLKVCCQNNGNTWVNEGYNVFWKQVLSHIPSCLGSCINMLGRPLFWSLFCLPGLCPHRMTMPPFTWHKWSIESFMSMTAMLTICHGSVTRSQPNCRLMGDSGMALDTAFSTTINKTQN